MTTPDYEGVGPGWFVRRDPEDGYVDLFLGSPLDADPRRYCSMSGDGGVYGCDVVWPKGRPWGDLAAALECLVKAHYRVTTTGEVAP